MQLFKRGLIILVSLIIIWQLIVTVFQLPIYILPSPLLVIQSLGKEAQLILEQSWITIIEASVGFLLSFIIGSIGALFLIYFRPAYLWFLPILLISQALPTFAIAPILVIWLGYGMGSKIVTTMIMLFFPITSAFYDGLRRTNLGYLDLAKVMNASKWQTLWRIQVPAALPALGSGLRLATVYAPMGAVIGEWVGSSRGLGFLILNANARMQIDSMFAALIVLVVLTLGFYFLIDFLLKLFITWQTEI